MDNEVTPLVTKIGKNHLRLFELKDKNYISNFNFSKYSYIRHLTYVEISVSEALQNSDILGTSSSSSSSQSDPTGLGLSGLFDAGDQVLTQSLIQSASGYIGDGLKSLADTLTGKS